MKIRYTKHAQSKFKILKELGWDIKSKNIKDGLKTPIGVKKGYSNTKVSSNTLTKTHNLRIIYSEKSGIITIITFYPVKKGRYGKK